MLKENVTVLVWRDSVGVVCLTHCHMSSGGRCIENISVVFEISLRSRSYPAGEDDFRHPTIGVGA